MVRLQANCRGRRCVHTDAAIPHQSILPRRAGLRAPGDHAARGERLGDPAVGLELRLAGRRPAAERVRARRQGLADRRPRGPADRQRRPAARRHDRDPEQEVRRLLHRRRQGGRAERLGVQRDRGRLHPRQVRPARHVVARGADDRQLVPARRLHPHGPVGQHVHHLRAQQGRHELDQRRRREHPLPLQRRPAALVRGRRLERERQHLPLDRGRHRSGGLPERRERHVHQLDRAQQRQHQRRHDHQLPQPRDDHEPARQARGRHHRRSQPVRRGADRHLRGAVLDGHRRLLLLRLGAGALPVVLVDLLRADRLRPADPDRGRQLRGHGHRLQRLRQQRHPGRRRGRNGREGPPSSTSTTTASWMPASPARPPTRRATS